MRIVSLHIFLICALSIFGFSPAMAQQEYHSAAAFGLKGNVKKLKHFDINKPTHFQSVTSRSNLIEVFTFSGNGEINSSYDYYLGLNENGFHQTQPISRLKYDNNKYLVYRAEGHKNPKLFSYQYKQQGNNILLSTETVDFNNHDENDIITFTYLYNDQGDLIKRIEKGYTGHKEGRRQYTDEVIYEIISRDSHKNWRHRIAKRVKDNQVITWEEKRDIEYYDYADKPMPYKSDSKVAQSTQETVTPVATTNPVTVKKEVNEYDLSLNLMLNSIAGYGKIGDSIEALNALLSNAGIKRSYETGKEISFAFCDNNSKMPENLKNIRQVKIKDIPDNYTQINVSYSKLDNGKMRCLYIFWFGNATGDQLRQKANSLENALLKEAEKTGLNFSYYSQNKRYAATDMTLGTVLVWLTEFKTDLGVALLIDK